MIRSPLTRMTESFTAAAPVPSTSRAPTIAVTGPAAPRCASGEASEGQQNRGAQEQSFTSHHVLRSEWSL